MHLPQETLTRLVKLTQTVHIALATKNYSVRLDKNEESEEVELLVDVFNEVLTRLHEQEQQLEKKRPKVSGDPDITNKKVEAGRQNQGVFLTNISHELRVPLHTIISYSEILQEEAADLGQKVLLPDLQKITLLGRLALDWVDEILDLSKIESGRLELVSHSFEILNLIRDTQAAMMPIISQAGNTLDVQCDSAIGTMNADQKRIQRVLFTLLKIASKATPQGIVQLKVRREMVRGDDWVRFDIIDSGPGISPELLMSLFKGQSHADTAIPSAYGGVALAIAVYQWFSLLIGGEFFAETWQSRGINFTFRLPAKTEPHLLQSQAICGTNKLICDLLNISKGDFQ